MAREPNYPPVTLPSEGLSDPTVTGDAPSNPTTSFTKASESGDAAGAKILTPPIPETAHHEDRKFDAADFVVLLLCELIAIPLCHAGWEAVLSDHHVARGLVALAIGLPVGLLGGSFHWWKNKVSVPTKDFVQRGARFWWPMALFLAFCYLAGPEIYRRATNVSPTGAMFADEAVKKATSQISAERDTAFRNVDRLTKERDEAVRVIEELRRQRETPRQEPPPAVTRSSATQGPVNWYADSQLFVVSGGTPNAEVNGVLIMGKSTALTSIREAYLVSGFTGRRQILMANVQSKGAYFPVDKVDIPRDAPVQLDAIFNPPIPLREFLDQWGKFRVIITYSDGMSYERDYEEAYVRQKLQDHVPSAFGPRVTPRDEK